MLSTRFLMGAKIGDGFGGTVRAAASAGDSILDPAIQPTAAAMTTTTTAPAKTATRFPAMP